MKKYNIVTLALLILSIFLMTGCSNDYQVDSEITGVIKEVNKKDKIIVVIGSLKDKATITNTYEIPTKDVEEYEIGQKVDVTIYSNLNEDIWDPSHMKFEITTVGDTEFVISKVSISNSKGFDDIHADFFAVYEDEDTLKIFQDVISKAVKQPGIVDMRNPDYDLEVLYTDGNRQGFHLWLGDSGTSTLMNVEDTHTIYSIPEELTRQLIDLVK